MCVCVCVRVCLSVCVFLRFAAQAVEARAARHSDAIREKEEAFSAKFEHLEREFIREKARMAREHEAAVAGVRRHAREEAHKARARGVAWRGVAWRDRGGTRVCCF